MTYSLSRESTPAAMGTSPLQVSVTGQNVARWTATLAHMIWQARGGGSGDSLRDWFQAEAMLREYRYVDWYLLASIPLHELI